jgi:hypothetical protein
MPTAAVKINETVDKSEDRKIVTLSGIQSGVKFRSALANDDVSSLYELAA